MIVVRKGARLGGRGRRLFAGHPLDTATGIFVGVLGGRGENGRVPSGEMAYSAVVYAAKEICCWIRAVIWDIGIVEKSHADAWRC